MDVFRTELRPKLGWAATDLQVARDKPGSVFKGRPGQDLNHAGQSDSILDATVLATSPARISASRVIAMTLLSSPIRGILYPSPDLPDDGGVLDAYDI